MDTNIGLTTLVIDSIEERTVGDITTLTMFEQSKYGSRSGNKVEIEFDTYNWKYLLECLNEKLQARVDELEDELDKLKNCICRCNTESWGDDRNLTSPSGE